MAQITVSRWTVYSLVLALVASLAFASGAVYTARGDNHDTTYWACLYAGSLTQVGTTEPANCGRGAPISWNSTGVTGPSGTSQAFYTQIGGPLPVAPYTSSALPTTVASLEVPAGTYMIFASLNLQEFGTEDWDVRCAIQDPDTTPFSRVVLNGAIGGSGDFVTVAMQSTLTFDEPGVIDVYCGVFTSSDTVTVGAWNPRVTAIAVDAVNPAD